MVHSLLQILCLIPTLQRCLHSQSTEICWCEEGSKRNDEGERGVGGMNNMEKIDDGDNGMSCREVMSSAAVQEK